MRIAFLCLLAFCLQHTIAQTKKEKIDSLTEKLATDFMKNRSAVGLSIGIFNKGETHFYNFGSTSTDQKQQPTSHTIYEIGSITKTFVSLILANAVIENKVSLDDDIRKYLKGDYPNLEYNGHPIRLVHLANTSSLLPDWLPGLPAAMKGLSEDSALAIKTKFYERLTQKDFMNALHQVKLDTIPGSKRYHSNSDGQLLAYILEDVYKMPMDQLIRQYITLPNQMNNTAFIGSATQTGLATGYTSGGKKAAYEFLMPYFKNAGGLGSSTEDLTRYIKMLLDEKNAAAVLSLKKTIEVDASTGKIVPLRPEHTATPDVYSAALNWFKYQPEANQLQIWSDGGTNGFNAYLVMYPYIQSGIVLLANKSDEKIFRSLPGIAAQFSELLYKE